MTIFLDRINAAPIVNSDFDTQFLQWLWVLVDSLNETINDLEDALNLLTAQSYTAAQIATLDGDGELVDGVMLYDTTNNVYVGRISGVLVKFTTAVYP